MELCFWSTGDKDQEYYYKYLKPLNIPIVRSQHRPKGSVLLLEHGILKLLVKEVEDLKHAFFIDFLNIKKAQQLKSSLQSEQIVKKAIGKEVRSLLDMTGGWASDAVLFSLLGIEVTAIESNHGVYALTYDALMRLTASEDLIFQWIKNSVDSLEYIFSDSLEWLRQRPSDEFDVIYIDPMFPDKKSKALSPKPMQILQNLVGKNQNVMPLLQQALKKAKQRVIIKRHLSRM